VSIVRRFPWCSPLGVIGRTDLAEGVGSQRLAEAQSTDAKILVSACEQCERTLTTAACGDKVRMKVMDIAELVRRALDADDLR